MVSYMAKEQQHSIAWNIIGWNMKEPIIFKEEDILHIGCPLNKVKQLVLIYLAINLQAKSVSYHFLLHQQARFYPKDDLLCHV